MAIILNEYMTIHYYLNFNILIKKILFLSNKWRNNIMLSKTHGQPAVPTTMGKEFKVYHYRLEQQFNRLKNI